MTKTNDLLHELSQKENVVVHYIEPKSSPNLKQMFREGTAPGYEDEKLDYILDEIQADLPFDGQQEKTVIIVIKANA